MNAGLRILTVAGVVLLVGGLQALAFNSRVTPKIDWATQNLALLQQEVPGNHLLDETLSLLRDYRRISSGEVRKRQVLQLRQRVIEQFQESPRLAIEGFGSVVAGFEAQSAAEQEMLDTLQRNLFRLNEMYADHFAEAIESHSNPPWYFQPVAAMSTIDDSSRQKLDFNHAHYLTLVGQRGAANTIYNDLRMNTGSDVFKSRILFAQSRLQYDAFRVEQDPEYLRQSLQHAQQSLRHDSAYDQPKLFLEYLLSIDLQEVEVEGSPIEGQGSGEAEGERGAISTDTPEH